MAVVKLLKSSSAKTVASKTPKAATPAKKPAKDSVKVRPGELIATIGGKKIGVKDSYISQFTKAFILDGGKTIAFTGTDGAGGFENEGQSLRLYDVATGKSRKVMAGYNMIDSVKSVKTADGKSALLVAQSDGGLGGDHFSIVDPVQGGEVYQAPGLAKFVSQKGNMLKLAMFNEESYMNGKPRPIGYKAVDLRAVLFNKVIVNKPTWEEFK